MLFIYTFVKLITFNKLVPELVVTSNCSNARLPKYKYLFDENTTALVILNTFEQLQQSIKQIIGYYNTIPDTIIKLDINVCYESRRNFHNYMEKTLKKLPSNLKYLNFSKDSYHFPSRIAIIYAGINTLDIFYNKITNPGNILINDGNYIPA